MKTSIKAAIVVLALTASATPMLAQAQDRHHDRGERNDRHDRGNRGPQRDYRPHDRPAPHHVRPRNDDRRSATPQRWNRNDPNWWRGHRDFRDYRGARSGHWYAPGYGYYRVDQRYNGYRWRSGAYLPAAYRSYYVRDPNFYGLRPAPRGYRYVHAGNDIVMIALATGLITSVINGIY